MTQEDLPVEPMLAELRRIARLLKWVIGLLTFLAVLMFLTLGKL